MRTLGIVKTVNVLEQGIVSFRADFEVSDVAATNSVRFVRIEFSIEYVLKIGGCGFNRLNWNFTRKNFGQVHRFNEATNSGLTDFEVIFTLQQDSKFIDAKPLLAPAVQSEDVGLNQFILFSTSEFGGGKMLVVGAAIDFKPPAERFYFVLKTKPMNSF